MVDYYVESMCTVSPTVMIHIRRQATWHLIWVLAVDIACDVLPVSAK